MVAGNNDDPIKEGNSIQINNSLGLRFISFHLLLILSILFYWVNLMIVDVVFSD
jgi:hypothetical protein